MDAILSHNTLQYRFLVQVRHELNYVELMFPFNVAAIKDGRTCKLQSVQSFRSSSRTATGYWHKCRQSDVEKKLNILEILSQLNFVELILPFDLMLTQKGWRHARPSSNPCNAFDLCAVFG